MMSASVQSPRQTVPPTTLTQSVPMDEKMLVLYILDFCRKRNHQSAYLCFYNDAVVPMNPLVYSAVSEPMAVPEIAVPIDAPDGGFLLEWWSVFWDMFKARNRNGSSSEATTVVDYLRLKASRPDPFRPKIQQSSSPPKKSTSSSPPSASSTTATDLGLVSSDYNNNNNSSSICSSSSGRGNSADNLKSTSEVISNSSKSGVKSNINTATVTDNDENRSDYSSRDLEQARSSSYQRQQQLQQMIRMQQQKVAQFGGISSDQQIVVVSPQESYFPQEDREKENISQEELMLIKENNHKNNSSNVGLITYEMHDIEKVKTATADCFSSSGLRILPQNQQLLQQQQVIPRIQTNAQHLMMKQMSQNQLHQQQQKQQQQQQQQQQQHQHQQLVQLNQQNNNAFQQSQSLLRRNNQIFPNHFSSPNGTGSSSASLVKIPNVGGGSSTLDHGGGLPLNFTTTQNNNNHNASTANIQELNHQLHQQQQQQQQQMHHNFNASASNPLIPQNFVQNLRPKKISVEIRKRSRIESGQHCLIPTSSNTSSNTNSSSSPKNNNIQTRIGQFQSNQSDITENNNIFTASPQNQVIPSNQQHKLQQQLPRPHPPQYSQLSYNAARSYRNSNGPGVLLPPGAMSQLTNQSDLNNQQQFQQQQNVERLIQKRNMNATLPMQQQAALHYQQQKQAAFQFQQHQQQQQQQHHHQQHQNHQHHQNLQHHQHQQQQQHLAVQMQQNQYFMQGNNNNGRLAMSSSIQQNQQYGKQQNSLLSNQAIMNSGIFQPQVIISENIIDSSPPLLNQQEQLSINMQQQQLINNNTLSPNATGFSTITSSSIQNKNALCKRKSAPHPIQTNGVPAIAGTRTPLTSPASRPRKQGSVQQIKQHRDQMSQDKDIQLLPFQPSLEGFEQNNLQQKNLMKTRKIDARNTLQRTNSNVPGLKQKRLTPIMMDSQNPLSPNQVGVSEDIDNQLEEEENDLQFNSTKEYNITCQSSLTTSSYGLKQKLPEEHISSSQNLFGQMLLDTSTIGCSKMLPVATVQYQNICKNMDIEKNSSSHLKINANSEEGKNSSNSSFEIDNVGMNMGMPDLEFIDTPFDPPDQTAPLALAATFVGQNTKITACAMHFSGLYVATGGHNGSLVIWSTQSGEKVVEQSRHTQQITTLRFNGSHLVTASFDGKLCVYTVLENNQYMDTNELLKHKVTFDVGKVATGADVVGDYAFAIDGEGVLRCFDISRGGELCANLKLSSSSTGQYSSNPLKAHCNQIAFTLECQLGLIDVNNSILSREQVRLFTTQHRRKIHALDWSFDGRLLVTASEDIVIVWDALKHVQVRSMLSQSGKITSVSFLRSSSTYVAFGQYENLFLWNQLSSNDNELEQSSKETKPLVVSGAHLGCNIACLANGFTVQNESYLVSTCACKDLNIKLWKMLE